MRVVYFHRNLLCGYSINKVTQTIIRNIPNKEEFFVPCKRASLVSILTNILFVYKHRDKHAINHITGDIHYCMLALIGCTSVLTIHDTVVIDFHKSSKLKKLLIEWLWFRLPLMIATKVVCISDQTRQSVMKYTNRKDIVVIYNAIDPLFKTFPPQKHFKELPTVLIVGTNPNKNLLRTFEALQGVKCKVKIIGELNENHLAALKKYQISYENKHNLSDEQILEEYAKCDVVSFVSLFEGFGMIVIEANKVGRPVVCSDIPVLREIAGDAALFVDPYSVVNIQNAFLQLMRDDNTYNGYVEKGLENASKYDCVLIFQKWNKLYKTIFQASILPLT